MNFIISILSYEKKTSKVKQKIFSLLFFPISLSYIRRLTGLIIVPNYIKSYISVTL